MCLKSDESLSFRRAFSISIFSLLVLACCMNTFASQTVPLDQWITNGSLEYNEASLQLPSGFSTEKGFFCNNGVPFTLGGVSRRDIVNPLQGYDGNGEDWIDEMTNDLVNMYINKCNFMRITTIIYWQNPVTPIPSATAVPNDWYLFKKVSADPRLFRLEIPDPDATPVPSATPDPELTPNTEYIEALQTVLNEAEEKGIVVELELFDNCILRVSDVSDASIRWPMSPFANCVEEATVWPGGVPNDGLPEFYANTVLRDYMKNYAAWLTDAADSYDNVIFATMNETDEGSYGNDFEEDILDTINARQSGHLTSINRFGQGEPSYYDDVDLVSLHGGHWTDSTYWGEIAEEEKTAIISTDAGGSLSAASYALARGIPFEHEGSDDQGDRADEMAIIKDLNRTSCFGIPIAGWIPNKANVEPFDLVNRVMLLYAPEEVISLSLRFNETGMPELGDWNLYVILKGPSQDYWCIYNDQQGLNAVYLPLDSTENFLATLEPFNPGNSGDKIELPDGIPAENSGTYTFFAGYFDTSNATNPIMDDPRTQEIDFVSGNIGVCEFTVGTSAASYSLGPPSILRNMGIYESKREIIIPFWQSGETLNSMFCMYNLSSSGSSATSLNVSLNLYDASGLVDQSPAYSLLTGDREFVTTEPNGWYSGGDGIGAAVVRLDYDTMPSDDDLLAIWAAIYSETSGPKPAFGVAAQSSPVKTRVWPKLGGRLTPIPIWVNDQVQTSFFQAFNSPSSCHDALVTFTWRTMNGTELDSEQLRIEPGTCASPDLPSGALFGTGDVLVEFDGSAGIDDQISLYSALYGEVSISSEDVAAGYSVALDVAEDPLPGGSPTQTIFPIEIPLWQEGWGQHTIWAVANPSDAEDTITVWLELYGEGGYSGSVVETSDARELDPGEGTVFDTLIDPYTTWYNNPQPSGGHIGPAYLFVEYESSPSEADTVALWSAVYGVATTGHHTGFQVTTPRSPIRPRNIDQGVIGFTRQGDGAGKYLLPFWVQNNTTDEHTYWSIWNSPDSVDEATIVLTLRDLDGIYSQQITRYLDPGEFIQLDTGPWGQWYSMSQGLCGVGEIDVSFETSDESNRVQLWSCYYGITEGMQVGTEIDIR